MLNDENHRDDHIDRNSRTEDSQALRGIRYHHRRLATHHHLVQPLGFCSLLVVNPIHNKFMYHTMTRLCNR